jgi:hypothetical protein
MLENLDHSSVVSPSDTCMIFPQSVDEQKATAQRTIDALRAYSHAGLQPNIDAAAAIGTVKATLGHGEFGRFRDEELGISKEYCARLLKLNKLRPHLSDALAWAATNNHRLAECRSARSLITLVHDWLKRDRPSKPRAISKKRDAPQAQDAEAISKLRSDLARCEEEFVALRDPLPVDVREKAYVALSSSREHELVAIAKRFHWRVSDLRRELQM